MSERVFYMPKTGPDGEPPVVVLIGPASFEMRKQFTDRGERTICLPCEKGYPKHKYEFPGDPLLGSASSYKEVATRLHAVTCGAVVSRADCWMCAPTEGHKIFFRAVERQADLKFLWQYAPELLV